MPPLAPDNTARFKLFYTNLSVQHTLQVRSGESPASIGALFDALFSSITGSIASTTFDEVQWAPSGSDIFNAVITGVEGNTYGIGGHPASAAATFWSLVGRTSGGRRVRYFFYGVGGMGTDYRYNAGESAAPDNLLGTMIANSGDVQGIDGLEPVFKNYVNAGVNAHLQRALRP